MSDRTVVEAPPLSPSADDIVWGAEDIARVIGRTPRQTFNLLEKGHLPAKLIGRRWVASRSKLLAAVLGE